MLGMLGGLVGKIAGKVAGGAGSLADLPGAAAGKLGSLSVLSKPTFGENGLGQLSNLKNNTLNYQNKAQDHGDEAMEVGHRNNLHTLNKTTQLQTEMKLAQMVSDQTLAMGNLWSKFGNAIKDQTSR